MDPEFFSKEFKELFNGMVAEDVRDRFTLEDVKMSKWYNGPVLTSEQLAAAMKLFFQ